MFFLICPLPPPREINVPMAPFTFNHDFYGPDQRMNGACTKESSKLICFLKYPFIGGGLAFPFLEPIKISCNDNTINW